MTHFSILWHLCCTIARAATQVVLLSLCRELHFSNSWLDLCTGASCVGAACHDKQERGLPGGHGGAGGACQAAAAAESSGALELDSRGVHHAEHERGDPAGAACPCESRRHDRLPGRPQLWPAHAAGGPLPSCCMPAYEPQSISSGIYCLLVHDVCSIRTHSMSAISFNP